MFLRHTKRWKGGKEHFYWSLVENRQRRGNRIVQHTLLESLPPRPSNRLAIHTRQ